jgi:hypothetical protein
VGGRARRAEGGTLQPMLQGIEESGLAKLKSAIDAKDAKPFEAAYPRTMAECHACHELAGKPYLRPRIPEVSATRIIDMKPGAN